MNGCNGSLLRIFADDEAGATAIEYALIASGVGAVVASTVFAVGDEVKTNFYDKLVNLFRDPA